MRVLHVNKGYRLYGGVENYIRLLVENNIGDYRVDVLAINDRCKFASYKEKDSHIIELPLVINFKSLRLGLFFNLVFLLRVWSYDIVHFHYPNPNGEILAFLSSVVLRKKVVYTFHNEVTSDKPGSKLYFKFSRIVLSKVSKIIVTSPQILESSDLLRLLRASSPEKFAIIPLGISIKSKTNIRVARSGALRVVFIGRLVSLKGVEFLIEAVNDLEGISLEVVGDGNMMSDLAKMGRGNVKFHGYVDAVLKEKILLEADVLALPSINRGEGFGYVILEAMQNFCAIVSTELGTGSSYANVDSVTGLVVCPRDVIALRKALLYLRDHPNALERMKCNSRDRVKAKFSIDLVTKNITEIYEAI